MSDGKSRPALEHLLTDPFAMPMIMVIAWSVGRAPRRGERGLRPRLIRLMMIARQVTAGRPPGETPTPNVTFVN